MAEEKNENEARKKKYYEVVSVQFPSYDKGRDEFLAKINTYEMQHEVLSREFSLIWNNGSFVWTMLFCCETEGEY